VKKDVAHLELVAIALYESHVRAAPPGLSPSWGAMSSKQRDKWRADAKKMLDEASDEEWERDF
jgi:hypothetical protein